MPPGSPDGFAPTSNAGGVIRTLRVSLLAVAALAVGILVSKQRQDRPDSLHTVPGDATPSPDRSLEAIRAAGL